MSTAYINARIVDPASGLDVHGAVLVENGQILDLGSHLFGAGVPSGIEVVDCEGHVLAPGLVDMRVFTGEPGEEHRESLASASDAAAAGGVTTMVVMPNTSPVIDDAALVDFITRRARDTARVRVEIMAALTKGLAGQEMTEFGLLREAGAVAFTDGTRPVMNAQLLRRALTYSKLFNGLIVQHAEDPTLAAAGVMNEGELSTRLGLAGIPSEAETIIVERDLRLVELTGGRYHVSQVSCGETLDVIRQAKAEGLPVTCGASADHISLNEGDIGEYRTFFKLSPPLRGEDDRQAILRGLADGTIDVVVSGHDPQDTDAKRRPFAEAAYGAVGLETLLPVVLERVHNEELSLTEALATVTCKPADILGLPAGRLKAGAAADMVLINLGTPWVVDADALRSKSKNTAHESRRFQGRAIRTVVAGETVHTA
ncbi:dihydroorotase [Pyruvatibacter mobilis]|uniref:dihydroorotase n=1 Tax=Pyruvatibacter mobilis TaxID=1712261 RepID=UPI003C7E2C92